MKHRRSLLAAIMRPSRVAHAHSGTESYAYVDVDGPRVSGNVQFPIHDLNHVLGTEIPQDLAGALSGLADHHATVAAYARSHFDVGGWSMEFVGHRVLERKAGSYAILEYRIAKPPQPVPRRFVVTYDGIMHANHHHTGTVMVRTSAGLGPLLTQHEQRLEFSANNTDQTVSLADDSFRTDVSGAAACVGAGAKELFRRTKKRLRR